MRTNFETFKKGDRVCVIHDHPYLNKKELTPDVIYVIDKMISDAGVVTLEGKPYNKTYPDSMFVLSKDE